MDDRDFIENNDEEKIIDIDVEDYIFGGDFENEGFEDSVFDIEDFLDSSRRFYR